MRVGGLPTPHLLLCTVDTAVEEQHALYERAYECVYALVARAMPWVVCGPAATRPKGQAFGRYLNKHGRHKKCATVDVMDFEFLIRGGVFVSLPAI